MLILNNWWLLILLVLWACLLFGGFIFGKFDAERTRRMPAWTRMVSSFTLVLAGWSWYFVAIGTRAETYALLIAIGMTLGFIGDLFMAELIPVGQSVLGGIGSFGLGHIAYIWAILHLGNSSTLNDAPSRWLGWAVWLVGGLVGWFLVVYLGGKGKRGVLHYAALPYALLLASTAGCATGLALQSGAFIPLAIGAALFLFSDLLIAAQLFNNLKFLLVSDLVWLTYGPAQMLIVYSVGNALTLF